MSKKFFWGIFPLVFLVALTLFEYSTEYSPENKGETSRVVRTDTFNKVNQSKKVGKKLFGTTTPISQNNPAKVKTRAVQSLNKLPLRFEANRGQTDQQVRFMSHGDGYGLFFTPQETVLVLKGKNLDTNIVTASSIRMRLMGANPNPQILGKEKLVTKTNYLKGRDPSKWQRNIPNYSKVLYKDVYPNIDLIYYGNPHSLEYDYILFPGADPGVIEMEFEGAESMVLDDQGNLLIKTQSRKILQHAPKIYQQIRGKKEKVAGGYILKKDNRVGYKVASYNQELPLVIDPILEFSSYLGGTGGIGFSDLANDIAVAGSGAVYIVGEAGSTDFPTTTGAYDETHGDFRDAFVARFNATGTDLDFSTYVGGDSGDVAYGIVLDASLNAYVTGMTESDNFPTAGTPISTEVLGNRDAFVFQLSSSGASLPNSTYIGGDGDEIGRAIAIDSSLDLYITGQTTGSFSPLTNAFQSTFGGGDFDAFLVKLDAAGVIYSTYLGGSESEEGRAIAVDDDNHPYIAGETSSSNMPVGDLAVYDASLNGGADGFISGFYNDGSGVFYSTYLGGSDDTNMDRTLAIAVNGSTSEIYVTGATDSTDFPTKNAFQSTHLSGNHIDAYVTKLDPNINGSGSLIYSSYLGGGEDDQGRGIDINSAGNAFVAGFTKSDDFPTVNPLQTFSHADGAEDDAFVTVMSTPSSGNGILFFSSYMGGDGDDKALAIDVDSASDIYITGVTSSSDYPTTNGVVQGTSSFGISGSDTFVSKIAGEPGTLQFTQITPGGFNFQGLEGGPQSSASIDFEVTNTGDNSYTLSVTTAENWLSSNLSGSVTVNPGNKINVSISANSNADTLPVGITSSSVFFNNITDGNGNVSQVAVIQVLPSDLVDLFLVNNLNAVKQFSGSTGDLIKTFIANVGSTAGQILVHPTSGNFLIAATTKVIEFDGETGDSLGIFGDTGNGDIVDAEFMSFHPGTGNLFIGDKFHDYILEYDGTTGVLQGTFVPTSGSFEPIGIAFHPITHNLFVADFNGEIEHFNGDTGSALGTFGQTDTNLTGPVAIAFHPITHNLLVSDFFTQDVREFNGTTGDFIGVFGETASRLNAEPHSLVFHPISNNLFVDDRDAGSLDVLEFDGVSGDFVGVFGDTGNETNVPQHLVFKPLPSMVVVPEEGFSASGQAGGPFSPDSKLYTVLNTTDSVLDVSLSNNENWITKSTSISGSETDISGFQVQPHLVSALNIEIDDDANVLSQGSHADTVTITNDTDGTGNTTRSVDLVIDGLDVFNLAGNPNPVGSGNSSVFSVLVVGDMGTGINYNWSANCPSLSNGTFDDNTLASPTWTAPINNSGSAQTCTISLNIDNGEGLMASDNFTQTVSFSGGTLSVTPADFLQSLGLVGGPFNPTTLDYTVSNTGGTAINFTATNSGNENWTTVTITGDTLLDPGEQSTVTVTIDSDANSLSAGSYSDTISFTNTTNGIGNTTRDVDLSVLDVGTANLLVADFTSDGGVFEFDASQGGLVGTFKDTIKPNFIGFHPVTGNFLALFSNKILEYNGETGAFIGTLGDTDTNLSLARSFLVNPVTGNLLVADLINSDVRRFDASTGNYIGNFGNTSANVISPFGLAFHPVTGNLLVSDNDPSHADIREFDINTGNFIGAFNIDPVGGNPTAIIFNPNNGNLLVGENSTSSIIEFDGTTGAKIGTFGDATSSNLGDGPFQMAFHPISGDLFVPDPVMNGKVLEFNGFNGSLFGDFGAVDASVETPIALAFRPLSALLVTPLASLDVFGSEGGPFSPSSEDYLLQNSGSSSLTYSISKNESWVSVKEDDNGTFTETTGGTLGVGESITLRIEINSNANSLAAGDHSDTVTITNTTNGDGNTTRTVNLTINNFSVTNISGTPNPVDSGNSASLSASVVGDEGTGLVFAWTSDCPNGLPNEGTFSDATIANPIWTAPVNTTGSQQSCTITVDVNNGQGLQDSSSFSQAVNFEIDLNTASFSNSGQNLGIDNTNGMGLGDLDGDGDLDAFFANGNGKANKVFLNNGQGVFFDTGQKINVKDSNDVALGDLDGDGDLDAFIANGSGQGNNAMRNNGQASFTAFGNSQGNGNSYAVGLGDLNGDGDLDAFIANDGSNKVWDNFGDGNFSDFGQALGASNSRDVALGDLDGDGDLDAFVANASQQANRVWLNNGKGEFSNSGQALGSASSFGVALGDMDGDGDLDAIVANAGTVDDQGTNDVNEVWLNDGNGNFSIHQNLMTTVSHAVALVDVDGDGDLDAVFANHSQVVLGEINFPNDIFTNDGSATFTQSDQFLGGEESNDIQMADLDNDGDQDAFFGNSGPNKVWFNEEELPARILPIEDEIAVVGTEYIGPSPVFTGGAPITWTLLSGPTGMTINGSTGVVTWPEPVEGFNLVSIRADNGVESDIESWGVQANDNGIAPDIEPIANQTVVEDVPFSLPPLEVSGTEPITFLKVNGPTDLTVDAVTGEINWDAPTQTGSPHTVSIQAVNFDEGVPIGSDTESFDITVVADPIAPVISAVPDAFIESVASYEFTPTVSGTAPMFWTLLEGPEGMTIDSNTGKLRWQNPTLDGSPHPVSVFVVNSVNFDSESWNLNVTAPAEVIDNITIIEQETFVDTVKINTNDTPTLTGDPQTCDRTQGPPGMVVQLIEPGVQGIDEFCLNNWPNPLSVDSPYTVQMDIGDDLGNTHTERFILTVVKPVPIIDPIANQSTDAGETFIGPTPIVSGIKPIVWDLLAGPPGMVIDELTGVVAWPNPTPGNHIVILQAENEAGIDTEFFSLRVTGSLVAPVIISPGLQSGTAPDLKPQLNVNPPEATVRIQAGIPYTGPSFTVTGVRPIDWALFAGPADMTIDPVTGVVSWANPIETGSPFTITVLAENANGSDTVSWLLDVDDELDAPQIDNSFEVEEIEEGVKYTVDIPVEEGQSPFSCQLINSPEGMTAEFFRAGLGFAEHCKVTWDEPVPAANNAAHPVKLRITDERGLSDEVDWQLLVSPVAGPVVSPVNDKTIVPGVIYTESLDIISGTNPVSWRLTSKPDGMLIDDELGIVTWAKPVLGSHVVTAEAGNGASIGIESWTVHVQNTLIPDLSLDNGPFGFPNPVETAGDVAMILEATDNQSSSLTFSWSAECATLGDNGSFNDPALKNPIWFAPPNPLGTQENCIIKVIVSNGEGLSEEAQFIQGVLPPGQFEFINIIRNHFHPACFRQSCNQSLTKFSVTNTAAVRRKIKVEASKNWLDIDPDPVVTDNVPEFDIPVVHDVIVPQANSASVELDPNQTATFTAQINNNITALGKGNSEGRVMFVDEDTGDPLGSFDIALTVLADPFAGDKSDKVFSPYWQADNQVYTFLAFSHPGLEDMSSKIGVVLNAIQNDGAPFGPNVEFTVTEDSTQRVFIVGTNNPVINPEFIPTAHFISGTTSGRHGQLVIAPKATHPDTRLGSGGATGQGYPAVTMLNIWGAVVVQATSTGFAMEFVGDGQDSRAIHFPVVSGIN